MYVDWMTECYSSFFACSCCTKSYRVLVKVGIYTWKWGGFFEE